MGILAECMDMVRALRLERGFRVCELGDQYITQGTRELAEQWYRRELRAGYYVSLDGNGRGTHTADLNRPLELKLGTFDLVTDFGTGEHVFDQAQVWKTIHGLTRVGGYIAFDRPAEGYHANGGHGFYNVQECLLRDIAVANYYEIVCLERHEEIRGACWRGVFRRGGRSKFRVPQQGRYRKLLRPITGELPPEKHRGERHA